MSIKKLIAAVLSVLLVAALCSCGKSSGSEKAEAYGIHHAIITVKDYGEIKVELNGIENNISHTRGVISMARSSDYNSASSQFFIMHADGTHLDGQYAAFGHVTDGMDVVDAIAENTPTSDGMVAKENQPVIESIVITD